MKKILETDLLLDITDDIRNNCEYLSCTDAEDAEFDIDCYVPVIKQLVDDLEELISEAPEAPNGGQADE